MITYLPTGFRVKDTLVDWPQIASIKAFKVERLNYDTEQAAKILSNPNALATAKFLAASGFAEAHTGKGTRKVMEGKASMVLQSDQFSNSTKSRAGTVLSRSYKKR